MAATIIHNSREQCFVLEWQGQQARLEYQLQPAVGHVPPQVNFNHTYLPPELRGQGLAEQLVQFGLLWASQQNLHVVASCWYVAKIMSVNAAADADRVNKNV